MKNLVVLLLFLSEPMACLSQTLESLSRDFVEMSKGIYKQNEYFGNNILKANIPMCCTNKVALGELKKYLMEQLEGEELSQRLNVSGFANCRERLNLLASTIFSVNHDFEVANLHATATGDLMQFMSYLGQRSDVEKISPDKRYTNYLVHYFIIKSMKEMEFKFSPDSKGRMSSYPPDLKLFLRFPSTSESRDFLCRYIFITTNFIHFDFDRLEKNELHKSYRSSAEVPVDSLNIFEWYFQEIINPMGIESEFNNIRDEYIKRIQSVRPFKVPEKGSFDIGVTL